ncbi:MAG: hypothetical protein ACRDHF_00190 [Tepidiformaceae bacterium]
MLIRRCCLALLLVLAPVAAAQAPPEKGILHLQNARWDRVRVEVRIGPSADCEANATFRTYTVRRGRAWRVKSDQVICWRRESDPDTPGSAWIAWESVQLTANRVHRVNL